MTPSVVDGALEIEVRDDGAGDRSGLLGLHDRAAAMNGELRVSSPPGEGTVVAARLPLPERRSARLPKEPAG